MTSYYNWRSPSSLFPPSAIISITDDNSTNFVARPAAFGPRLPAHALSGQLWTGSGFGSDHLGRGGSGAGAGGELGCSDVPGWDDESWLNAKKPLSDSKKTPSDGPASKMGHSKRGEMVEKDDVYEDSGKEYPIEQDGTDDHLHHPLQASDALVSYSGSKGTSKKPTHADIQSIQEGAEIAGKVVLLSRGGCGFLEKVKWVQRRGGIALIVGDDIRGGPLVTMYARGDTSNVTIPSLFTSYTTAQLLSSLMPGGGHSLVDNGKAVVVGKKADVEQDSAADRPNFTSTSAAHKGTPTPRATKSAARDRKISDDSGLEDKHRHPAGWFASFFGNGAAQHADSRRPPSSGNVGWVQQEEFEDDEVEVGKHGTTSTIAAAKSITTSKSGSDDGFVIGVQDWRDPDLVAEQKEQQKGSTTTSSSSSVQKPESATTSALKGGSITPGSGEYSKAHHEEADDSGSKGSHSGEELALQHGHGREASSRGWFGRLFSSHDIDIESKSHPASAKDLSQPAGNPQKSTTDSADHTPKSMKGAPHHDGLWVTLSQTSMSSSPFFDTLLVLVVSPLVTLTVVYALLLLRSRIRRRRWRAPKSVVERLPVRTYQTMPSTSTSSSTSISSHASVTTPLLPASRPINAQIRPRSRTTSEVHGASSMRSNDMASSSLEQIEEKRAAGLAEWRRRYGGKQRECVVCLEEYVDGVSRVMSLPCGHEFHAECM